MKDYPKPNIYRLTVNPGDYVKFKVNRKRICTGKTIGESWIPCPDIRTSENLVCTNCDIDDFYNCRAKCIGKFCNPKSIQAKALCDINETSLYITYVGGVFKVGVSLNPIRRWIEQGSYFGLILTKGNGLTIRSFERNISKTFNLENVVSSSTKLKTLGAKLLSFETIETKFVEFCQKIEKLKLFDLPNNLSIKDLRPNYGKIPELINQKVIVDNEFIFGKVIGVIGKIIVVKDKNTYYGTNLSKVMGHVVSNTFSVKRQRSLFDF